MTNTHTQSGEGAVMGVGKAAALTPAGFECSRPLSAAEAVLPSPGVSGALRWPAAGVGLPGQQSGHPCPAAAAGRGRAEAAAAREQQSGL